MAKKAVCTLDTYAQSGDLTADQLQAEAQSANGTLVEKVRDIATGRPVKVVLALPDNAPQNALDNIANNPGVATTGMYPRVEMADDFESYDEGYNLGIYGMGFGTHSVVAAAAALAGAKGVDVINDFYGNIGPAGYQPIFQMSRTTLKFKIVTADASLPTSFQFAGVVVQYNPGTPGWEAVYYNDAGTLVTVAISGGPDVGTESTLSIEWASSGYALVRFATGTWFRFDIKPGMAGSMLNVKNPVGAAGSLFIDDYSIYELA